MNSAEKTDFRRNETSSFILWTRGNISSSSSKREYRTKIEGTKTRLV